MAIRLMDDVAAPGVVGAVNIVAKEWAPNWSSWITYGMTALGYGGAALGFGGNFVKNIGVSSLPLTLSTIYDTVRGGASRKVADRRLAFRPAANPGSVRQTVFPEYEEVRVS